MYTVLVCSEKDRFIEGLFNENTSDQEAIEIIMERVLYKKDYSILLFKDNDILAVFNKDKKLIIDLSFVTWDNNYHNVPNHGFDECYTIKCTFQ